MSYQDEKYFTDNKLYALIWILVACLLGCALFKGCEANSRWDEMQVAKAEAERNAVAFAQSECTSKGGTMYGTQCVVVCK